MGKSCSCLQSYPQEEKYQSNIHPPKTHSRSTYNNKCRYEAYSRNLNMRYARPRNPESASYHRLNTYSSSFMEEGSEFSEAHDAEQLQFPRVLTIGYIHQQIYEDSANRNALSLPLCVVELCRKYYFALNPMRRKRVVFTSMVQLNLCIDEIPAFILNESIFFFKVNKNELLDMISNKECDVFPSIPDGHPSNSAHSTQSHNSLSSLIQDLHPLLIKYLKKKYDDNLLLIMDETNDWQNISTQLMSMDDIWCDKQAQYRPLLLNKQHWIHYQSKYNVDSTDIIDEIAYNELKYAPTMEILWQSNPTLIPMRNFDLSQYEAENGHNIEYIGCNAYDDFDANTNIYNQTSSRDTIRLEEEEEEEAIPETAILPTASNADLVVLSMYNSGNDFSEISKTSYCDELSYTTNIYDMQIMHMDHDADLMNYVIFNNDIEEEHCCAAAIASSSSGCNLCHKYIYIH